MQHSSFVFRCLTKHFVHIAHSVHFGYFKNICCASLAPFTAAIAAFQFICACQNNKSLTEATMNQRGVKR